MRTSVSDGLDAELDDKDSSQGELHEIEPGPSLKPVLLVKCFAVHGSGDPCDGDGGDDGRVEDQLEREGPPRIGRSTEDAFACANREQKNVLEQSSLLLGAAAQCLT